MANGQGPGPCPLSLAALLLVRGEEKGAQLTRTSWMEMTEQGKAFLEVTLTITESTPSGNSYLKY